MSTATKKPRGQETPPNAAAGPAAFVPQLIPLGLIDPSRTNPRKKFDEVKLQELAESIRAKGLLQAILVRPHLHVVERGPLKGEYERYELVAGERRFRAAKLAGLTEIQATVRELSDVEVLEVQVIENEQRDDLSPMEKAEGYAELVKHGRKVEDLAQAIGKTPGTIYGLLKLLKLNDKARAAVAAGELPTSTAEVIARVPGEQARNAITKYALSQSYRHELPSLRDVKEEVRRNYMIELKQAPFDTKDAELLPSAGACTNCPHRTGNNRAEYPDGRGDVCTNPDCYNEKAETFTAAKAKDSGTSVVPAADRRKLIRHGSIRTFGSGYIDLAEKDFDRGGKTYKALLEPHLKPESIYLIDAPDGLHRLVKRATAAALLARHHKIKARSYGYQARPKSKADVKAERAKEKLRREVTREYIAKLFAKAEDVFGRFTSQSASAGDRAIVAKDARDLIRQVAGSCGFFYGDERLAIAAHYGVNGSSDAALEKKIDTLEFSKLLALAVVGVAIDGIENKRAAAILKTLAVDRAQVAATVKARLDRPADAGNAERNGTSRNGSHPPLDITPQTTSQGYDEALRRSIDQVGVDNDWRRLREAGASADDIRDVILAHFRRLLGSRDYHVVACGDANSCIAIKGKDPRFWFDRGMPIGKPTLQGRELVDQVRRLKAIPVPAADVGSDAATEAAYNAERPGKRKRELATA